MFGSHHADVCVLFLSHAFTAAEGSNEEVIDTNVPLNDSGSTKTHLKYIFLTNCDSL